MKKFIIFVVGLFVGVVLGITLTIKTIQIDSDCDGYTSASLLINYLNRLFPGFTQNNIIYRVHEKKQHGLILLAQDLLHNVLQV